MSELLGSRTGRVEPVTARGGGVLAPFVVLVAFALVATGCAWSPSPNTPPTGGGLTNVTLPTAVATTTYNANNQLRKWHSNAIQPTYDLNGNMLTDGTYTYVWNARNELVTVKQGAPVVATYAYDALGRRTSKTVSGTTSGFVYGGSLSGTVRLGRQSSLNPPFRRSFSKTKPPGRCHTSVNTRGRHSNAGLRN